MDYKVRHLFGPIRTERMVVVDPMASHAMINPDPQHLIDQATSIAYAEVARLLRRHQRAAVGCGCDRCVRAALVTIGWAEQIARQ